MARSRSRRKRNELEIVDLPETEINNVEVIDLEPEDQRGLVLCARRVCYEEEILGKPTTTIEKCVKICRSINKKK